MRHRAAPNDDEQVEPSIDPINTADSPADPAVDGPPVQLPPVQPADGTKNAVDAQREPALPQPVPPVASAQSKSVDVLPIADEVAAPGKKHLLEHVPDSHLAQVPSTGVQLYPSFWQRFRYWAWHPVARSSVAVLLVAGLLPMLLSLTQHLTANTNAAETLGPAAVVTVPVTISVPVTITSTPPPVIGTTALPAPVTVVRTTVLTTVQTTGAGDRSVVTTTTPPPALLGPNVGTKAVICFTHATLELTATGTGKVELNVAGAATAHRSGRGSAKLTVTGNTGTYTVTYAATAGNLAIRWSALQGACS